jgi:hypothetical protein
MFDSDFKQLRGLRRESINRRCKQSLQFAGQSGVKVEQARFCTGCKLSLHVNLVYRGIGLHCMSGTYHFVARRLCRMP